MKRFKYQALVRLVPPPGGGEAVLHGSARRMVVRARDRDTGRSRLFAALVSSDQGPPSGCSQLLVTMVVAGDDAGHCLAPGEHFALWRDGPAGDGLVTRRLFV